MTVLPQAYRAQLEDLEIYMGLIKERYRTALINYTVDDCTIRCFKYSIKNKN